MKRSLLLLSLLLLFSPATADARAVKHAGFIQDKGKEMTVSQPLGWPVKIRAGTNMRGSIQSLPGMVVVRLQAYTPWYKFFSKIPPSTTITVSGLPADQVLHVYTNGYRTHTTATTTSNGTLSFERPTGRGMQVIIQEKPSTIHIAIDPFFGPPGGDCTSVGTWNTTTKTCTLNQSVTETITIEDDGITLDGASHTVTGAGSASGIYTDVSGVTIKNISVSNFARGVVYADAFLTHAAGGEATNVTSSNNTIGLAIEGVPSVIISGSRFSGGTTGLSLVDQLDGFPTDNISVTGSTLSGIVTAVFADGVSATFTRNNFINNTADLSSSGSTLILTGGTLTRGNFWSKNTACAQDVANSSHCVDPYDAGPATDTLPWACENGWTHTCPVTPGGGGGGTGLSSVVFIPGIQGTRLFQDISFLPDIRRWEPQPDPMTASTEKLVLNRDGTEVSGINIYTRGIIEQIIPTTANIYQSFTEGTLDDLKDDSVIRDWKPLPYDWRFSQKDAATGDIKDGSGANDTYKMADVVENLARGSFTGKVTIVTHSNGGLVAKLLIDELANRGEVNLIDKLIMVAPPQVGTPKAVAAMLHGEKNDWGKRLALDQEDTRAIAETAPGVYTLLPSKKFFLEKPGPVVEFDSGLSILNDPFWVNLAGSQISSWQGMKDFLFANGSYDRNDAARTDVNYPNILNDAILTKVEPVQDTLDAWVPPSNIQVYQVVGWGLDTIETVKYITHKKCLDVDIDRSRCTRFENVAIPFVRTTSDGDETVVTQSADIFDGRAKYYVDISEYNNGPGKLLRLSREHGDIMEIDEVKDLISQIIEGPSLSLPRFITNDKPSDIADKRIRSYVFSPVTLEAHDSSGNHTGINPSSGPNDDVSVIDEQIANSYYWEYGEVKYLGMNADDNYEIKMKGLENGTFTLVIEEVVGDTVVNTSIFEDVVITSNSQAKIYVSDIDTPAVGALELDRNGDGTFEVTIQPNNGAKITICHVPPGNLGNPQTINVGLPALKAHLGHGDYEGICDSRESINKIKDKSQPVRNPKVKKK